MSSFGDTVCKGLKPFKKKGGDPFTGGRSAYRIANSYGTALGKGDPVRVSNGAIHVAVNTTSGATGVFGGCKYIDSNTKQPVESSLWVASTSSGGLLEGDARAIGYVYEGTDLTFLAQVESALSAGHVGATFPVSVGTPDAIMKRSVARVHASVNSSVGGNMVRVLGFPDPADLTVVEVELVDPVITYA